MIKKGTIDWEVYNNFLNETAKINNVKREDLRRWAEVLIRAIDLVE